MLDCARWHTLTRHSSASPFGGAMKRCSKCEMDLPESEFSVDRSKKDGLQIYCKGYGEGNWLEVAALCNSCHGKAHRVEIA
jgi:hypothetical protein